MKTREKRKLGDRVKIRPLKREEAREADKIMRIAFGTFLHLPDPTQMFGDRQSLPTAGSWNSEAVFAREF